MKTFTSILISILVTSFGFAVESDIATTADGRKVQLNADGTWKLIESKSKSANTGTDSTYQKPADAKLFVKAPKGPFGIWINERKWKQVDSEGDANTQNFDHKKGDGYAMIIAERIGMPLESLKKSALSNAREAAPDMKVISEEKRMVNGKEILCMKILGTIEGTPFMYYNYYYSCPEGSLQVVTYTAANLFGEFKEDFEQFLNGIEISN